MSIEAVPRKHAPATAAPTPLGEPSPPSTDALIFRVSKTALSLVGGSGRGAGWMGIVDLPREGEPLASRVVGSSKPAHVDGPDGEPMRVIGPYWAAHALLVPVGGEHLVVFGGSRPLAEPDATLMPLAARLVAELEQVPPDKLLADELEVVQAVRDMMDSRAQTVEETARHIATRAADPLSCELGAVLFRSNGRLVAEVVTRDWPARLDKEKLRATLVRLFARVEGGRSSSRSSRRPPMTRWDGTRGWSRDSPFPSAMPSRSACSWSPTRRAVRGASPTCASGSATRSRLRRRRC